MNIGLTNLPAILATTYAIIFAFGAWGMLTIRPNLSGYLMAIFTGGFVIWSMTLWAIKPPR